MRILLLHAAALSVVVLLPHLALGQATGEMSLEERFRRLDQDRDGFVTWAEARPQREAEHRRLDHNGDGALTGSEFEERSMPFEAFDADRDGRISLAEYLGKHREMFLGADIDGDGQISLPEFRRVRERIRTGGG